MGLISFFYNYYKSLRCHYSRKDRILEIQQQRFRRLLRQTVKNSEFYQDLYKGIDIEKCRLSDLPIVTKTAMMNNFDRFITDSRLKLRDIQEWIADKNNYGKLYLGEFLPIPTSGSSGENAVAVYHRKALDLIQAGFVARQPLRAKRSANDHIKMFDSQLLGGESTHCNHRDFSQQYYAVNAGFLFRLCCPCRVANQISYIFKTLWADMRSSIPTGL